MEKKSNVGAIVQLIFVILVIIGVGLFFLGWHFDSEYGNWQGPYPVTERLDLPEEYVYEGWGDQCHYHGPSSLVVLGVEDDQVLYEYRNETERDRWHECRRGRRFLTLSEWNRLATRIQNSLTLRAEQHRAEATEEERIRRARERLNKATGQGDQE